MTPTLPSLGAPLPVSVDRVGMIRRSMRCFVFGLIGAVPLFGLGMACLALRLWRQLAEETGEPARLAWGNTSFIVFSCLATVLLLFFDQAGLVLALGFLLSPLQGWLLFRQYRRTKPVVWNPARHLVYWGAGLALAGLNLSGTIILLAAWATIRNL
jgi:hypothetical protein